MQRPLLTCIILACTVILTTNAYCQSAPIALSVAEVTIPNTRIVDFMSSVNGHRYRLHVALPLVAAPARGYRVLYIFDGNSYFGSTTEAVRMNGNASDVMVVGIGYPDSVEFAAESDARRGPPTREEQALEPVERARHRERPYDLTLPATDAELAAWWYPAPAKFKSADVGGLDELLKTIEVDVKPRIASMAPIDVSNQALFGHSFGGLAVLRALFTEPEAFRTFIISSPSIWWNHRSVLAEEAAFVARAKAGKIAPRVLFTVGGMESDLPHLATHETAFAVKANNMVGNARDLSARLQAVKGAPGYEVGDFACFPNQGHGISVWPAIGRAVEFAFQRRD